MPGCNEVAHNSLANTWLRFMGVVRGAPIVDQARKAKLMLETSIKEIQKNELVLKSELSAIALRVKQTHNPKTKSTLNALLCTSRAKRMKLTAAVKKRAALEQHMDTLASSELNQSVMSSVRETSQVLKAMGLDKSLDSVEEMMLDMEESTQDASSIQSSLATSFTGEDPSDESDLQREMEMLLNDENDAYTLMNTPPHSNSMTPSAAQPALPVTKPEQDPATWAEVVAGPPLASIPESAELETTLVESPEFHAVRPHAVPLDA